MILPSDDNSTPRKKPGKRKPEPSAQPSEAFEDGEFQETLNEFSQDLGPMEGAGLPDLDPLEWRELLKEELVNAVEDLENFPDPELEFDPPDPPDLYSFYSELISLREELAGRLPAGSSIAHLPTALAVQLGILAGEMKAAGQELFAERLLSLVDELSD